MGTTEPGASFGDLLRRYRRAAELTQEELAERAGVSIRSISDLERGGAHVPRRDTVGMIVGALDLKGTERSALEAAVARRRGPRQLATLDEPATAPSHAQAPHNLPRQLTSFIGRDQQMTELAQALDLTPLLTLTGPGGVGKTRLAYELARDRVAQYPDGVWLIELADLADPEGVTGAVAAALRVPERTGLTITQCLADHLQSKHVLLVIDNCEHLVGACAACIATLLRECPDLRVLATSREPLGVPGEVTWQVQPLDLPELPASVEQIARAPAARLLLDRANAVRPISVTSEESEALVRICACLDGIPLALELAAAGLRALSVHELADRLEHNPGLLASRSRTGRPQHQTLRAAIEWSLVLLGAHERLLFQRLAVFSGTWSLPLAEDVCSAPGIERSDVLELLARLVEKSMVVVDVRSESARYRMLEPIRQYAVELFESSDEAATLRGRHAAVVADLAETGQAQLAGSDEIASLNRLELDHPNFRMALRWLLESGDGQAALRLTAALWRFWERRGYYQEGCRWLEHALAVSDNAPDELRGNALCALATMYWSKGDAGRARLPAEQALVACRRAEDTRGTAWALLSLGMIAYYEADEARAVELLEEGVVSARQSPDGALLSLALSSLGRVLLWSRGPLEARVGSTLAESLSLARMVGSMHATSQALGGLAELAGRRADFVEATSAWQQALILRWQLQDQRGIATSLERMAQAAAELGYFERAATLWGAAEMRRQALGVALRHDEENDRTRLTAIARRGGGDVAFSAARSNGRALPLAEVVTFALQESLSLHSPEIR